MKIHILPPEIFSQIAAGEVVEGPRSIVKELVENSIDAGATAISIYIEEGGLKSISIIDNGCGIESSEVEKAFLPHSTSKISSAEELNALKTLGFRGEALASISAVAEVTLKTKYVDENNGTLLVVKGAQIIKKEIAAIEKGTNINVSQLFYNTPARYKFLKSAKTEENAVTATVAGLLIANPNVSFDYYVDNQLKYFTSEISLKAAATTVFGQDFEEKALDISAQEGDVSVYGYVSYPELTKSNRNLQYLVINGRVVNDAAISAVVQNAYGNRLMTRTFPLFCIVITMPADDVDVNVHPNKSEVRLSTPRLIHGLVYRAIKNALEAFDNHNRHYVFAPSAEPATETEKKTEQPNSIFTPQRSFSISVPKTTFEPQINSTVKVSAPQAATMYRPNTVFVEEQLDFDVFPKIDKSQTVNVIGQIFDTYLIIECGKEVFLIDQHAAHERVLFDKLLKDFDEKNPPSQSLLLPCEIVFDNTELEFFKANAAQLSELGFEISIDNDILTVKAIPMCLTSVEIKGLFLALLEELKGQNSLKLSAVFKQKLASSACKAAIKGGDRLTKEQISYFIDYFKTSGAPMQCPHGRPTVKRIDKAQIEKLFKRIV